MPVSQEVLREYAGINRRRKSAGITPLEYQRWLDLSMKLESAFPNHAAPGSSGTTRVIVEYATEACLRESIMIEIKPVGLFAATPFAAEPGTRFELCVRITDSGEEYTGPIVVASNNVGPGYSTMALGMGLRFTESRCALRQKLEKLCGLEAEQATS